MKIHPKSAHTCFSFAFIGAAICNTCDGTEMLWEMVCLLLPPTTQEQDMLCSPHLHVHDVETEHREHWIPKHPSTAYVSPFQSLINERQQAGTLLFPLHHAIPPAWNSPIVFSLNSTARVLLTSWGQKNLFTRSCGRDSPSLWEQKCDVIVKTKMLESGFKVRVRLDLEALNDVIQDGGMDVTLVSKH